MALIGNDLLEEQARREWPSRLPRGRPRDMLNAVLG